jgi:hypothetical protein
VQEDLLVRMIETQALLDDPLAALGPGIGVWIMMGISHRTGRTLVKEPAGDGGRFTRIETPRNAGDSLVPYAETLRWGGNAMSYKVHPYDEGTEAHAMLCADETITEHIRFFLKVPVPEPVDIIA